MIDKWAETIIPHIQHITHNSKHTTFPTPTSAAVPVHLPQHVVPGIALSEQTRRGRQIVVQGHVVGHLLGEGEHGLAKLGVPELLWSENKINSNCCSALIRDKL